MSRRITLVACLTLVTRLEHGRFIRRSAQRSSRAAHQHHRRAARPANGGPIKLARHPDYHAGQDRLQLHGRHLDRQRRRLRRAPHHRQRRARRVSALLARRTMDRVLVEPLRQLRRVRRPAAGGTPKRLTYLLRQRRRRRLDARWAEGPASDPRAATARSRTSRRSTRSPSPADRNSRCRSTGADYGDYSPDGKSLVFNRHPAIVVAQALSRQLRGRPLDRRPRRRRPTRQLLADERYNRYWPMWGADDADLLRRRSAAERQDRQAGQPRGARERQQHLQDSRRSGGQPVQVTKHADGSLFWPSMSSDGKVIVYEDSFGIWKLDVATGRTQRDQDRHRAPTRRRTNSTVETVQQRGRHLRHLAVGPARGDLRARPDPDDRDRARRHHARRCRTRWRRATRPRSGRPTASTSRSCRTGRAATRSGSPIPKGERRRRSPTSTTRRARSSGRPTPSRCSTRPRTRSSTATASPTARRPSSPSSDVGRIGSVAVSPDSKWVAFAKQDRTLRSHVYIVADRRR